MLKEIPIYPKEFIFNPYFKEQMKINYKWNSDITKKLKIKIFHKKIE